MDKIEEAAWWVLVKAAFLIVCFAAGYWIGATALITISALAKGHCNHGR